MFKHVTLVMAILALTLTPAALADGKKGAKGGAKKGESKKGPKSQELKPGDGKKDPTLLAKTIAEMMKNFGGMMKEQNPVKNLSKLQKIMDSLFNALVRMETRGMWADLKVLLQAYISIIKDVGPAQFKRAQAVTKKYKSQRKLAAKDGLALYKSFIRYRSWMNKFYNSKDIPKDLKPTVKTAIDETDKLIKRFVKWMLALPGINKGKLKGAAEDAMDKFGKATNEGGGGDAVRKAGEALRGIR